MGVEACRALRPRRIDGTAHIAGAVGIAAAGIVAAIIATTLPPRMLDAVDAHLSTYSVLASARSPAYGPFSNSSDPLADSSTLEVFLFNCTNPDDVISGSKPALEQIGPISLAVGGRVIDAQWESATEPGVPDSGNDVLSYRQWIYHLAAEDAAGGGGNGPVRSTEAAAEVEDPASPLSVRITSLYIPLVTLVAHGYGPSSFEAPAASGGGGRPSSPVPTRLRRILTGDCDGSEAAASPQTTTSSSSSLADAAATPDAYGCMLTPREAAAAETLRSAVRQARQVGAGGSSSGSGSPFNTLFVVKSARQLLFGYEDPIFEALNVLNPAFPSSYPGIIGNISSIEQARQVVGRSRIYTGAGGDIDASSSPSPFSVRAYAAWNGMSSLYCCAVGPCGDAGADGPLAEPAWGTDAANAVRGTGPSQFPRGVSPSDTLRVFTDRFVRSMDLSYQPGLGAGGTMPSSSSSSSSAGGADTDTTGLPALRFGYSAAQFDNAAHFPANAAYYMTPDLPDGLLNTTTCSLGRVPLFYSKPYFLGGNASLNDRSGLPTGKRFLHDTWVDVEPRSGKALATHMRHQTNVYVDSMQVPEMSAPRAPGSQAGAGAGGSRSLQGSGGLFPMMAAVYFPLLWVDAHTQVSQAWVEDFQANVVAPTETAGTLRVVGASVAAFAGVVAALLLLVARSRRSSFTAARRHVDAGALIATHTGHEGVRALLLSSADEPAAAAAATAAGAAALEGGPGPKALLSSTSETGACVPRRRSSSSRTVEVGGTASTPRSMDSSGSMPSFSALLDGEGDGAGSAAAAGAAAAGAGNAAAAYGGGAGPEGRGAVGQQPLRSRSRELLRQLDADLAAIFAPPPATSARPASS